MANILPMISAYLQILVIAVAFLIYLAAGITYALGWYLWEWWDRAFGDEGRA